MKGILFTLLFLAFVSSGIHSQISDSLATQKSLDKKTLKFSINSSGSHYIQAIFFSQNKFYNLSGIKHI